MNGSAEVDCALAILKVMVAAAAANSALTWTLRKATRHTAEMDFAEGCRRHHDPRRLQSRRTAVRRSHGTCRSLSPTAAV
jgi:hypothetical protein